MVRGERRVTTGLPPGLDEVVVFTSVSTDRQPTVTRNHSAPSDYAEVFVNLAVRVGARWYLAPALNPSASWGTAGVEILDVAAAPARPTPVLEVRTATSQSPSLRFFWHEEDLAIVGVGPSGRPAVLAPVMIARDDGDSPYGGRDWDKNDHTERAWAIRPDALVITRQTRTHTECDRVTVARRAVAERYPLAFP